MKTLGAWLRAFPPHTIGGSGTGVVAYTDLANIYTAQQKVQTSGSGEDGIVSESTANTSAASGNYKLRRTRTGVANDVLGHFEWEGKNAGAADLLYALDYCIIVDPTVGAEHSRRGIRTKRAGTDSDWYFESGALRHQTLTQPDAAGKINVVALQVGNVQLGNSVLQRFYDEVKGEPSPETAIIALDDTTPLVSEGTQLFTRAVTPKVATSRIRIDLHVQWGSSSGAGSDAIFALFQGSTCIAAWSDEAASTGGNIFNQCIELVSGSTTARTYSLRYGGATAFQFRINESGSQFNLGGNMVSSMTITEFLA